MRDFIGCRICGGKLASIRGRFPGMPNREVCPTCLQERIEHIFEICNPDTYVANTDSPSSRSTTQDEL